MSNKKNRISNRKQDKTGRVRKELEIEGHFCKVYTSLQHPKSQLVDLDVKQFTAEDAVALGMPRYKELVASKYYPILERYYGDNLRSDMASHIDIETMMAIMALCAVDDDEEIKGAYIDVSYPKEQRYKDRIVEYVSELGFKAYMPANYIEGGLKSFKDGISFKVINMKEVR